MRKPAMSEDQQLTSLRMLADHLQLPRHNRYEFLTSDAQDHKVRSVECLKWVERYYLIAKERPVGDHDTLHRPLTPQRAILNFAPKLGQA
jgi:hypothetical protein